MPTDFFYALTLPFNFLRLKGFPFFLPYLPTSGTDSWLHRLPTPFFREPSQSPKKQLLTKKGNIQTEYFISENGRYIRAPANKESHLPKGRSVSSEIPSRSAGISLISGANHSDSYEKTILQRIACMIRQTFSTVYSEYNQRISSPYCLPSPIARRIFLTNLFSMQNGISHSRTSASSASSEAPMHQNKKDPEQKNVRSLLSSIYRLAI